MDRKVCVLVYSQYSPSSKTLIEYIQSLPYDLVKLTGMTLLSVDSQEVKQAVLDKSITYVPSLIVQYFDGTNQLFEKEYIYKWIAAIDKTVAGRNQHQQQTDNAVHSREQQQQQQHGQYGGREARDGLPAAASNDTPPSITNLNDIGGDIEGGKPSGAREDEYPIKSTGKAMNILAAAMEMQKSRESDEQPLPPGAPRKKLY